MISLKTKFLFGGALLAPGALFLFHFEATVSPGGATGVVGFARPGLLAIAMVLVGFLFIVAAVISLVRDIQKSKRGA